MSVRGGLPAGANQGCATTWAMTKANSGVSMEEWSGSGATKQLQAYLEDYNDAMARQTDQLVALTWRLVMLTYVLVAGLGIQIIPLSLPTEAVGKKTTALLVQSATPAAWRLSGLVSDRENPPAGSPVPV